MEDYLDEETEWVKTRLEAICSEWNAKVRPASAPLPLAAG